MQDQISKSKVKLLLTFGIIVLLMFYVICYRIIFINNNVRPIFRRHLATDTMQPSPNNEPTLRLRSSIEHKNNRPVISRSRAPIDDYYRYPCIKGTDYERSNRSCPRTICTESDCEYEVNCTFLHLEIINNTRICTYDSNTDFVARAIKHLGGWEDNLVHNMMMVLRSHPDMMLFDIGCNIGVYTLVAAWMGRHVVCVDANYQNIDMVYRTLQLTNLIENVTLILNGLSMIRGEAHLKIPKVNIGGSRLQYNSVSLEEKTNFSGISLQTILLDDLQQFVRGKPIFMKMDVEDFEYNVLIGGRQFLTNSDVRYLQMEFYRTNTQRKHIATLLRQYGFLLFREPEGLQRVAIKSLETFDSTDVYFIKPVELLKEIL